MDTGSLYRFGACEVDTRLRQVRRDGAVIESQPRVFDLLLYLIAHRDRVVDKDELLEKLWPGVVVSESALTQAVRKARSLVGDDGDLQAVIRTVPRRGFRFVAELEVPGAGNGPEAASPPAESSVAVLPFVDMSPQQDAQYFCDGMAEEIINELTRNPRLRVASRTSAFAFKNRQDDVRDIGRHLGVATVLEGSVRKWQDRLRVTAQLVDARSGFHLWSERWDRKLQDMLAIQDEIARLIAAALREPPASGTGTATVSADELYRRGMAYLHRGGQRSQRFAIELFHQALAIEPRHARAWAGEAISHVVLCRPITEEHLRSAAEATAKAMEIDPHSPEAWTARGVIAEARGDFAAARGAFEQAVEHGPRLFEAYYYYADACIENGRYEEAAALYEQAAELSPDDYLALVFARQAYSSLGDTKRADAAARRQLAAAERALAADPTDARALSVSAASLATLGRAEDAHAWAARACALEPDEPYVHYNAACALAMLGRTDDALTTLERIYPERLCRVPWVEHDDDLAALRGDPRFRALFGS